MAQITAGMVKELREVTGAGIMDCKKALTDSEGNFQAAVEALQIKKKAKAAKKSARIAAEGQVASYVHMGGKIGVLCEINCETDFAAKSEAFSAFVHDICMHIAAMNPAVIATGDVAEADVASQKKIFVAQVIEEGKPEHLAERIVGGKVKKWLNEQALMEQKFVKEPDKTIGEHLALISGEIGEKISIRRFARYEMGEGLEKRRENLADEVAALGG